MNILKNERGFTLIEILVVLAIVAVLFMVLIPQLNASILKSRESGVRNDFRSFQASSELFLRETQGDNIQIDSFNTFLDAENKIIQNGSMMQTKKKDPWNNSYEVEFKDKIIIFSSYGKEGDPAKKIYQLWSFYYNGHVYSCTIGFGLNNILTGDAPEDYACGESIVVDSTPPIIDSSTNETVQKPFGSGTLSNPYIIKTIGELQWMKNDLNGYYELGNDINAFETVNWNDSLGFDPIGGRTVGTEFNGTLDGKNYTINGLAINRPDESFIGLFTINKGTVKNVNMYNTVITANNLAGALAGYNKGKISNVSIKAKIEGGKSIGGMFGYDLSGIISSVQVESDIKGTDRIGGVIGDSSGTTLTDSKIKTSVIGKNAVGGITGNANSSTIKHSNVTGVILSNGITYSDGTKEGIAGGLIGYMRSGTIRESFADVTITSKEQSGNGLLVGITYEAAKIYDSYAKGFIKGIENTGGIVGNLTNGSSVINAYTYGHVDGGAGSFKGGAIGRDTGSNTISNVFYDKNTTGQNDVGKGIGKTTVEMKNQSMYVGWDFTNIWTINPAINNGYPYLKNNPPN